MKSVAESGYMCSEILDEMIRLTKLCENFPTNITTKGGFFSEIMVNYLLFFHLSKLYGHFDRVVWNRTEKIEFFNKKN